MNLISLDIETTGLSPEDSIVRAVGLSSADGHEALVGDEADILRRLEVRIKALPDDAVIVTWNGEEFDLPFLRARADRLGITCSLALTATDRVGKYGDPVYDATWAGRHHVDVAPLYRDVAEVSEIRWSLKPVARHVLGVEPIEVDRRGASIAAMAEAELVDYVCSDTAVTLELALRVEPGLIASAAQDSSR